MTPAVLFESPAVTPVDAVIVPLRPHEMRAVERGWRSERRRLGIRRQHAHWDWAAKAKRLYKTGAEGYVITAEGQIQGMMLLRVRQRILAGHPASQYSAHWSE